MWTWQSVINAASYPSLGGLSAWRYGVLTRTPAAILRVMLGLLRPRVENVEASVRPRRQFQIISGVGSGGIGDEFLGHVVRLSTFLRKMQLPQILQSRRFLDDVPRRRRSTFPGPVVHDCHPRRDSIHQRRAAALAPSVMRHGVDVSFSQLVSRSHQL